MNGCTGRPRGYTSWNGKPTAASIHDGRGSNAVELDHVHPLEWAFLVASACALVATATLFIVKLWDLNAVRRSGTNGPILFMATDKIRQQGFMLAVSSGMVMLAVASVLSPVLMNSQAQTFLAGGIVFSLAIVADALFIYWRRRLLEDMVALYDRPHVGGRRKTDPPA